MKARYIGQTDTTIWELGKVYDIICNFGAIFCVTDSKSKKVQVYDSWADFISNWAPLIEKGANIQGVKKVKVK